MVTWCKQGFCPNLVSISYSTIRHCKQLIHQCNFRALWDIHNISPWIVWFIFCVDTTHENVNWMLFWWLKPDDTFLQYFNLSAVIKQISNDKSCVKYNSWLHYNVHPEWHHDVQKRHLVRISIKLQRLVPEYYVPPEVINKLTLKRASKNYIRESNKKYFAWHLTTGSPEILSRVSSIGKAMLFTKQLNPHETAWNRLISKCLLEISTR